MLSAKRFYFDFLSAVSIDYWSEYHNNDLWTNRVIKIIRNLIEQYGMISQQEYYRIDVSGWVSHSQELNDEAQTVGLNSHLWDLKVTVEHENDPKDWTDELVKLAHIRCPLKIIIGYAPSDERDIENEQKRLDFAIKVLGKVEAFDFDSDEELLIILGNSAPRHKKSGGYKDFGYRGYLLNRITRKFQAISK